MPQPSAEEQLDALTEGAVDVVPREELAAKLARSVADGRPLRAKLGIDPSRPDLHLGHSVVLRKLRRFQDLGHTVVLIVGDFTGLVGDPSGRSETRPMLTPEEMATNAATYFEQAGLVLDVERAEVHGNAEWLSTMSMADVLRLTATTTVARMLERDDFQGRYRDGRPISIVEFLYPLMQAMDSVAVRADVELGGTDQTFNLLMGREVQRAYGQEPQVVLTMPLLEGTDGVRKMSKSLDNSVGLTEAPEEMFGKLMSIPDGQIVPYFRLLTDLDRDELGRVERAVSSGGAGVGRAKRRLAATVVATYHGAAAGRAAEERFDQVFRQHELPADIPEMDVARATVVEEPTAGVAMLSHPALLVELGLAASRSEARRLIVQGGVRRDGSPVGQDVERLTGPVESLVGTVWQVGKRRFARVRSVR